MEQVSINVLSYTLHSRSVVEEFTFECYWNCLNW